MPSPTTPAPLTAPLPTRSSTPRELRNVIGGESVDGVGTFEKIDPVDGTPIAVVHEAGPREVDRAVAAARAALEGPWGRMPVAERARL
ncbi:aldehyde dehydrogenase family protein, partial [Agromyces binzhouensis]